MEPSCFVFPPDMQPYPEPERNGNLETQKQAAIRFALLTALPLSVILAVILGHVFIGLGKELKPQSPKRSKTKKSRKKKK
jgi:hypothetical protein